MIDAYPLQWPPAWPRTARPRPARFDTNFGAARKALMNELRMLGATDIVISSNVALRRDNLPYAGQKQPDDPAIAVYFKLNGENQCVPCDKWSRTEDNLQAIRKTIEALRGLERWGAKEMVNAAFRGFKALPESVIVTPNTSRTWWEVLGVEMDAPEHIIRLAYKKLAFEKHPDHGGSDYEFAELQRAYKQALANLKQGEEE